MCVSCVLCVCNVYSISRVCPVYVSFMCVTGVVVPVYVCVSVVILLLYPQCVVLVCYVMCVMCVPVLCYCSCMFRLWLVYVCFM